MADVLFIISHSNATNILGTYIMLYIIHISYLYISIFFLLKVTYTEINYVDLTILQLDLIN